jgi:hypothetical protein
VSRSASWGDILTDSLSLVGINSLDGLFNRARRCSKSRPGTAHALEDEIGIFGEHIKKREAVSLAYQKRRTDVGEPRCALGQQWVAQGCRRTAGKNTSIRIRAPENCRHADRITHGLDQDFKRAGKSMIRSQLVLIAHRSSSPHRNWTDMFTSCLRACWPTADGRSLPPRTCSIGCIYRSSLASSDRTIATVWTVFPSPMRPD